MIQKRRANFAGGLRQALLAVVVAAILWAPTAAAEFCSDIRARYSGGIMRCVDFANPMEAAINGTDAAGNPAISTRLFNGACRDVPLDAKEPKNQEL
jgi:hypothetical protein